MSHIFRHLGIGDTRRDLLLIASDSGGPIDLQGKTAVFEAKNRLTGDVVVSETAAAVERAKAITLSSGRFLAYGHALDKNDIVRFTASGMPTGLSATEFYRIHESFADSFTITTCDGKTRVVPTTNGTSVNVHRVGELAYVWQSADVDTALTLDCRFRIVESGKRETYPRDPEARLYVIIS